MPPLTTSWLFTRASRAGLFDELVKIGEAEDRRERFARATRAIGAGAAGTGAGLLAAYGLERAAPRFFHAKPPITKGRLRAVQISLPILTGVGAMLGDSYRKRMDDALSEKRHLHDR